MSNETLILEIIYITVVTEFFYIHVYEYFMYVYKSEIHSFCYVVNEVQFHSYSVFFPHKNFAFILFTLANLRVLFSNIFWSFVLFSKFCILKSVTCSFLLKFKNESSLEDVL